MIFKRLHKPYFIQKFNKDIPQTATLSDGPAIIVTKNFDPSQFVNYTYNYTHTGEEGNLPACRAKTPPALGQFFKG